MKKIVSKYLAFAVCAVVAWAGGMGFAFFQMGGFDSLNMKLNEIDQYVRGSYLGKIDEKALFKCAVNGYIDGLGDKYAKYYTSDEWKKWEDFNSGVISGIGISLSTNDKGELIVASVYPNSPAAAAGIQAGDVIVKVDEIEITKSNISEVLKGEVGSEVSLTIDRNGDVFARALVRENIEVPSVEYFMDGENGYVKIDVFTDSSARQFEEALLNLQNKGARALIFDVRNNGGGTISSVCKMLNMLIPSGIIATQVDLNGHESVLGTSDENEINLPMVVITNENTASAAELFVCDLKDYGKARQVGKKTYGKGVLQTTKMLGDGGAIKVTTAYFNPAKSENFNEIGVIPDIDVDLSEDKEKLYLNSKLNLCDDDQYQAALKLLQN